MDAFKRIQSEAQEKAPGCGQADLARLRDEIERVKGSVAEMTTEALFMQGARPRLRSAAAAAPAAVAARPGPAGPHPCLALPACRAERAPLRSPQR